LKSKEITDINTQIDEAKMKKKEDQDKEKKDEYPPDIQTQMNAYRAQIKSYNKIIDDILKKLED